ncbi:MAG TPA: hypothetical protein VIK89_10035 [Cytophagaceae bacterium]
MKDDLQKKSPESYNNINSFSNHTDSPELKSYPAHPDTLRPVQMSTEEPESTESQGHVIQKKDSDTSSTPPNGVNSATNLPPALSTLPPTEKGDEEFEKASLPPWTPSMIPNTDKDNNKGEEKEEKEKRDAIDVIQDGKDAVFKNSYSLGLVEKKLKIKGKDVKVASKITLHRGTPVVKGGIKGREDEIGDLAKLEGPSSEISYGLLDKSLKYSEKLLSGSIDVSQALPDLDDGFKIELKGDLGKIDLKDGKPDIKIGSIDLAGSYEVNKDNLNTSYIGQQIVSKLPTVAHLIKEGWKVKVEIKIELAVLTPDDIAKRLKINKLLDEQQKLLKEAEELEKKAKELKDTYNNKEKEFVKKTREKFEKSRKNAKKQWTKKLEEKAIKKFRNTKHAQGLKKQIGKTTSKATRIANQAKTLAKEIDTIAKTFSTKWGQMIGKKAMQTARFIATKVLSRLLIALAIIDTIITVAKLIKYFNHLKLSFDGEGIPLDEAPLLGEVPDEGSSQGSGEFEGTSDIENKSGNDSGNIEDDFFPEDFDIVTSDPLTSQGQDDQSVASESSSTDSDSKEEQNTSSIHLSSDALEKLAAKPENVQLLWDLLTESSDTGTVEDKHLEEFLKIVPEDIEEGEVYMLAALADSEVKVDPETALKVLNKMINEYIKYPNEDKEEIKENSEEKGKGDKTNTENESSGNHESSPKDTDGNETGNSNTDIYSYETVLVNTPPENLTDSIPVSFSFVSGDYKKDNKISVIIYFHTKHGVIPSNKINASIVSYTDKEVIIKLPETVVVYAKDQLGNTLYTCSLEKGDQKITITNNEK